VQRELGPDLHFAGESRPSQVPPHGSSAAGLELSGNPFIQRIHA
jgi:hypothetical protein